MISVSTEVVHCFVPGGHQPPIIPVPVGDLPVHDWCEQIFKRDQGRRELWTGILTPDIDMAHRQLMVDERFLRTYEGHQADVGWRNNAIPFLRVSRLAPTWRVIQY